MSRLAPVLAVWAIALAGLAGLTFALVLPSSALGDEPPAPTTTAPTPTEPAPDPAPPPPKPAPAKPKPKPAPSPVPSRPTYQPPPARTTQPVTSQPVLHSSKPAVRAHPKPKKVRHRTRAKRAAAVPKAKPTKTLGTVRVRGMLQANPGGSGDASSLLIVWGLALAIACFAIALIPPKVVPWRPAAVFVSDRQLDLTLIGVALVATAAVTLFLTRGP